MGTPMHCFPVWTGRSEVTFLSPLVEGFGAAAAGVLVGALAQRLAHSQKAQALNKKFRLWEERKP